MTDSPEPGAGPTARKRPGTILGRLSAAVREQNWFAVALELVIVVLVRRMLNGNRGWMLRETRALRDQVEAELNR